MTLAKVTAFFSTTFFNPHRRGAPNQLRGSRRPNSCGFAGVAALCLSVSSAQAQCLIIDDPGLYEERKQQAILLMQYGEMVVRATDGKIRCNDDPGQSRQICAIEGPGELLVDVGSARLIARFDGANSHVLYLSSDGAVTCGS